jgi:carboxypeptidase Taq
MTVMGEKYQKLAAHLAQLHNLTIAYRVLSWDQQVNMSPAGDAARATQMATVWRLRHELFASDKTAHLLEEAAREIEGMPFDSDEASLIRVARREYDAAVKQSSEFVARLTQARNLATTIWAKARANNDFKAFQPTLEQLIDLKIEEAQQIGYTAHPYDALLEQVEPGMTTAEVKAIFDGHRPPLTALIAAIAKQANKISDAPVHQHFEIEKQREFGLSISKAFGFDYNRGRLDISVHPFEVQFSRDDVRMTTRYDENFLNPALFSMLHETGHGLHAQGFGTSVEGTYLSDLDASSGAIAESQSRMWENVVGRSRGFWKWAYPKLKDKFPAQFAKVDVEAFYRAVNTVRPQFIRVEADEATYNLHIILRFELELELLTGKLKVADLPGAWNGRFEQFFGIVPPSDKEGALQDIHWSQGAFGYFPSYALGNLLSAEFFNKAVQDIPSIPEDITRGKFDPLLNWATTNLYQHGRKFTAAELVRRVTCDPIQWQPYLAYLEAKFKEIY